MRSVVRAALLLELLRAADGDMTLQELTEGSGLAKASVFRMLRTLEQVAFVERLPRVERYRLGVRCLELGQAYLDNVDLRREALPVMEQLRDEYKETIHLGLLDQELRVVYVEQLAGSHAVGVMTARVGRTAPSHCTGVGKALLASRRDDVVALLEQRGALRCWTSNTITDPDRLRAELALTRRRKYALDREEHEVGVKCVAAAIPAPGDAFAALSVAGPAHRMPDRLLQKLAPVVEAAAGEVGRRLGALTEPSASSLR